VSEGERWILHVDMDAFFVAVEVLDDPSLRGKPVVVGGDGMRGVVAAASYEARMFGVHSAMPSTRAKRACPHAVFLPGRYWRYQEVSEQVFDVFRSFSPLVEGISLDEAFLDVTGAVRLFGPPPSIAAQVRARVREELNLSCSVGVAPNKHLAKLASEAAKPRASLRGVDPGLGVKVVAPGEEVAFLHPLPVGALWGVGPATRTKLERLGVRTVGDLAALPVTTVVGALGEAVGRHLHELAWGRDDRAVVPESAPKSVGHEETFAADHHDLETLRREAVRMADAVAGRLRHHGLVARTVQVKVRFSDFHTITRAVTLPAPVDDGPAVARAAKDLLGAVDPTQGVRLLGVSVTGLADGGTRQLTLDDAAGAGWDEASGAVDRIRSRFGSAAIGPAAVVGPDGLRVKRRGDQQWGPGSSAGGAGNGPR
jgi:DNA polymerase IV